MTVEQWLRHFYKPDRFRNEPGFNADREERLIADRENDIRRSGYALISHHDSVTGRGEYIGVLPSWVKDPSDVGFTELTN
jgi:hypothetical protein